MFITLKIDGIEPPMKIFKKIPMIKKALSQVLARVKNMHSLFPDMNVESIEEIIIEDMYLSPAFKKEKAEAEGLAMQGLVKKKDYGRYLGIGNSIRIHPK